MKPATTSLATLDAAIDWHLRLAAGDADNVAFETWLGEPEHARVWTQLQSLNQRISDVGRHGRVAITSAGGKQRRAVRNSLVMVTMMCGALLLAANRQWPVRDLLADYHTATGEYRELKLPDGTHVALDARSALDMEFDPTQRRVKLRSGRVLVETAHGDARPFIVATDEGELHALGTRFIVQRAATGDTRLTVLAAAVEATAHNGKKRVLQAGEDVVLDDLGMQTTGHAAGVADAWTHGMLAVENVPLSQVIAELARYTPAHIDVDAQIADLRVTGTFPLHQTNVALAALTSSLPIIEQRSTQWWISLRAR